MLPTGKRQQATADEGAGAEHKPTSTLIGKLQDEGTRLTATVWINGKYYIATIDTGATSSFISKTLASQITPGGNTTTRKQVKLADGRSVMINELIQVNMRLGNQETAIELLILHGVIDELVLGWDFLQKIGTTLECAGLKIQIPSKSRNNGWLEERISVVVTQDTEQEKIKKFLEAELPLFDTLKGTTTLAKHKITMKDDQPIKQRYFPKNPKMQAEINKQVDELLTKGCIEPSSSPHSAAIVMVKKKTGKWRLCVDFRQLNSRSIKDAYPIPRVQHILDQLREAKYITSLDLKDGYWQIPMNE